MSCALNENITPPYRAQTGAVLGTAAILFGIVLYTVAVLRTAWLCDDAYVGFRVVDNLVNGYGMRWNADERVMPSVHPLLMLLLAVPYFFTHEIFYTSILFSVLVSVAAVVIMVFTMPRSTLGALFGLMVLTLSSAFVEYSTSGLENCLTHLFVVLFAMIYFRGPVTLHRLFWLCFFVSLALLCRMDLLLLFLPALIAVVIPLRSWKAVGIMAVGFLPFEAWECFSLVYHGFPFANVAYCKLSTGLPLLELLAQGGRYFWFSLFTDPITLPICFAGALAPFIYRQWHRIWFALGIWLYLLYVVRIGGCFMSGRYFTAPLFMALILLVQREALKPLTFMRWIPAFLAAGLLGFVSPSPTLLSNSEFGNQGVPNTILIRVLSKSLPKGARCFSIRDERFVSYPGLGLLSANRGTNNGFAGVVLDRETEGREIRKSGKPVVKVAMAAGLLCYWGGPKAHFIESCAEADPLLAHLPAEYYPEWMIGHLFRIIPSGYVETLESGENKIEDKKLAEFYDHLCLITRGPILSLERLKTIVWMNLGCYQDLIDYERYRGNRWRSS